jgi:hypothetical protein
MPRKALTVGAALAVLGVAVLPAQAEAMPAIGPVIRATAAQADTLRFSLRERDVERSFRFNDADRSGSNTVGDSASGRIELLKGRRVVGGVRYTTTIVAQQGPTTWLLRSRDVVTIRRQRSARGGHLFTQYEHTEDFNRVPQVGDVQVITVVRGDGRFAGYTGEIRSRVVKVQRGQPQFVSSFNLVRQGS